MKRNIKSVILTIILAFAFALTGCNFSTNNQEKVKKQNTNTPANNPSGELPEEPELELDSSELPLTLEAITAGRIILTTKEAFERISIQKNNGLIFDVSNNIEVQPGDIIRFYGSNFKYEEGDPNSIYSFTTVNLTIECTADCYVYGNVMSLLYYTKFTGKTQIPGKYAFQKLFLNNTHIKNHETLDIVLPATTLSEGCYKKMFYGCTGLTRAPELPAETLTAECYNSMFLGCKNLNYIKCLATNISEADCTKNWIANVSDEGNFICSQNNSIWSYKDTFSGIPGGWISDPPFEKVNARELPLTLEAIEDGSILIEGVAAFSNLQYSINGGNKTEVESNWQGNYLIDNVKKGDKVCLFAQGRGPSPVSKIKCNSDFYIYGNIMSLLDPVNFSSNTVIEAPNTFKSLFGVEYSYWDHQDHPENYTHLKNCAIDLVLPAETLVANCYERMFTHCESLTVVADLPAEILAVECYASMYEGCVSLEIAPELPAETLAAGCYYSMFKDCTSLIYAPELPAKVLQIGCYSSMFEGCAGLIKAPNLPAETLLESCYSNMFKDCTKLTHAPVLPAKVLQARCYSGMFSGCFNLCEAPQLPAETLAISCYSSMFYGCTNLINAPELPATTLVKNCYQTMFMSCSQLKNAPELPAATLVDDCYSYMFSNCNNLHLIKCFATQSNATSVDLGTGLSGAGLLICNNPDLLGDFPENWVKSKGVPLTLEAINSYSKITVNNPGSFTNLKYLKNFKELNTCGTSSYKTISVNKGDIICFFADSKSGSDDLKIDCSYDCYIYGDVMSLAGYSNEAGQYIFNELFKNNTHIKNHPSEKLVLSATTLQTACYANMFEGCTGLTVAPELPAKTLMYNCYEGMFKGCTGLTVAPKLEAEELYDVCYKSMFEGCTGLTTAPELRASKLCSECYMNMFKDCTNLSYVKCLATQNHEYYNSDVTTNWLRNVSPTGTFVKAAGSDSYWQSLEYGIPEGWTVEVAQ